MLTIGKLGATRGQLQYYEAQVAAGIEDYYAGRGEVPGLWRGTGARALGLRADEPVECDAFMTLMRGCSPVSGTVLRRMGACSTVATLDLTFSAPKSVSVLFAVAEEDTSAVLLQAHEQAIDEALGYLEREACFTRRGHGGAERVRGEGLIAASDLRCTCTVPKGAVRVMEFAIGVFTVNLAAGLVLTVGPGRLLLGLVPHPQRTVRHVIELVAVVNRWAPRWLSGSGGDDGGGFDTQQAPAGAGLTNMGDSLAAVGGNLTVSCAPGRGSSVHVRVPLARDR